ncbi:IclR family transcriptional regulator [Geodermatophilus sabuli]|uniref:IclR family transcriptional regulator n=1 Tax=Geodermatophilus sabuli TaxID=1564158 RepID=A0A7K3VV55_9ACTN|nr:IclR family transcriptional regulator [Geodermatophilus sabuli]
MPALDRALRVLHLLQESPQHGYTITEIARTLDLPKSTAYNLCGALVRGQLIRQSRDGFQLGRGLLELGSAYVSSVNMVTEFYDVCRDAPLDLNAVVQLAVLDEDLQAVYLAEQDCNSGLRLGLGVGIGRRVPANCTACGKVLMSMLAPDELDRRLARTPELPRLTRRSITSRRGLLKEIADARTTGYAYDDGGVITGLTCVSTGFPTSHADGGLLAVSISASDDTMDDARREVIRGVLDDLVGRLRARL